MVEGDDAHLVVSVSAKDRTTVARAAAMDPVLQSDARLRSVVAVAEVEMRRRTMLPPRRLRVVPGGWYAAAPLAALVLAGCAHHVAGQQLDLVLQSVAGTGTGLTPAAGFPHARYTFFTDEDPAGCVEAVRVFDPGGHRIAGDPPGFQVTGGPPGYAYPSPVQAEIPSGTYRVQVDTTTAACHWSINEILNSMSTDDAPPTPESPPSAPRLDVELNSRTPATGFTVPISGIYHATVDYGPISAHCQFALAFRTATQVLEPVYVQPSLPAVSLPPNVPSPNPASVGGNAGADVPLYLVAGARQLSVSSTCGTTAWQLSLKPWVGPLGGGVQGFHAT